MKAARIRSGCKGDGGVAGKKRDGSCSPGNEWPRSPGQNLDFIVRIMKSLWNYWEGINMFLGYFDCLVRWQWLSIFLQINKSETPGLIFLCKLCSSASCWLSRFTPQMLPKSLHEPIPGILEKFLFRASSPIKWVSSVICSARPYPFVINWLRVLSLNSDRNWEKAKQQLS